MSEPARSCLRCVHLLWNATTTYCPIYHQHILAPVQMAWDCPSYEHEEET